MALRSGSRFLYGRYFDLDSEYTCLLIQTQFSYKLNSTTQGTFTGQNGIMVEVVE